MELNLIDTWRVWSESRTNQPIKEDKYLDGWKAEVPTNEEFNEVLRSTDEKIKTMAANGGATPWAPDLDYTSNGIVIGSDNVKYHAMKPSKNVNPVGDTTGSWVKAITAGLPVGSILFWPNTTPPPEWVVVKGQSTENLPKSIQDAYGPNLPNMDGLLVRSWVGDRTHHIQSGRKLLDKEDSAQGAHHHEASCTASVELNDTPAHHHQTYTEGVNVQDYRCAVAPYEHRWTNNTQSTESSIGTPKGDVNISVTVSPAGSGKLSVKNTNWVPIMFVGVLDKIEEVQKPEAPTIDENHPSGGTGTGGGTGGETGGGTGGGSTPDTPDTPDTPEPPKPSYPDTAEGDFNKELDSRLESWETGRHPTVDEIARQMSVIRTGMYKEIARGTATAWFHRATSKGDPVYVDAIQAAADQLQDAYKAQNPALSDAIISSLRDYFVGQVLYKAVTGDLDLDAWKTYVDEEKARAAAVDDQGHRYISNSQAESDKVLENFNLAVRGIVDKLLAPYPDTTPEQRQQYVDYYTNEQFRHISTARSDRAWLVTGTGLWIPVFTGSRLNLFNGIVIKRLQAYVDAGQLPDSGKDYDDFKPVVEGRLILQLMRGEVSLESPDAAARRRRRRR